MGMTPWEVFGCMMVLALLCFIAGYAIGQSNEATIWRLHARGSGTAIHSKGQFYYVMTERRYISEYLQRTKPTDEAAES